MRECAYLFLLILLLTAGCGGAKKPRFTKEEVDNIPFPERNHLPETSSGFVLAVGKKTLSADEIVLLFLETLGPTAKNSTLEQFKEMAAEQIEQAVTTRILNILLYEEARKDAGEGIEEVVEKLATQQMQAFFDGFGGDVAKADEALKEMGMTRQSYKDFQKMTILNQSYAASKVPDDIPITYGELLKAYNEMKDEFFARDATIKFQLIDIRSDALQVTDPGQNRIQLARDLASGLVKRMQSGEDLAVLADQYPGVSLRVFNEPVRPESLAEPYDICAAEALRMTAGEISQPVETGTGRRIFIVKLEEKQSKGYRPLEQVQ
ncbi:MAG: peptidylprolyl isomerase, partial [Planctomycetota bacterium]